MLKLTHVTGGYAGYPVIFDINFEIKPGQLVGLIGLNGAGKSTTLKHIIGLLTPQKGTIELNHQTLSQAADEYKQQLAYIPESPVLYRELTLKDHIDLTIKAYHLDEKTAWQKAKQLLGDLRLADKLDWFPINFSKGMKQKVMIVCAFITNAKLIIVDEPFLGLDPLAINVLLKLIQTHTNQGGSVLMSTHVLLTAEKYCDSFVVLNHGRIKAVGDMVALRKQAKQNDASLDELYRYFCQPSDGVGGVCDETNYR